MARGKSHCFSLIVAGTWGIFLSYNGDGPSKLMFSSTSGLLSSCEGHFSIFLKAWHGKRDVSGGERGDPGSHSSCHGDIGIPMNFQVDSGIVSLRSTELQVPV